MNTYLKSFAVNMKALDLPKLDLTEVYNEAYKARMFKPNMDKIDISVCSINNLLTQYVELTFFGYDKILRQLKVYTLNGTDKKLRMEFRRLEVDNDYSDFEIKRTHECQHVEQGHDLKFTTKVETFDSVEEASSRALEIVSLYGHIFPSSMFANNL